MLPRLVERYWEGPKPGAGSAAHALPSRSAASHSSAGSATHEIRR